MTCIRSTTWASPSRADDPAAYSCFTFDIAPYDGMVRLTIGHDELQAGGDMAKGIQQGRPTVLSSLKSLLETGAGIDVFAKSRAGRRASSLGSSNPPRSIVAHCGASPEHS